MPNDNEYPQASSADRTHAALSALLGSVPYAGAVLATVFEQVVVPDLERRRSEWFQNVSDRLLEVEQQQGHIIERLQENTEFVSAFIKSSQIVQSTHSPLIKKALENMLIAVAVGSNMDSSTVKYFLNQLDSFTDIHIKLLKFYYSPLEWYEQNERRIRVTENNSSLVYQLYDAYPELSEQTDIVYAIWRELQSSGFIQTGVELSSAGHSNSFTTPRLTSLGRKFVEFIR